MTEQRVILITGASRGIGRFLAEHYLRRGFSVVGCSRQPTDLAGDNYHHHCLDVGDEVAVRGMVAEIRSGLGRLGVLVNNAGTASMNPALLTPVTTAEAILRTNVLGTFLLCREAARLMRRTAGGRIVNMTSVAVPLRLEGEAVYAASKAAVITLTEILARELAPFGITVNAVGPAPVMTDLVRNVPQAAMDRLLDRLPIKRMGRMEDVANLVDFLVAPASDAVTGQAIFLGGA